MPQPLLRYQLQLAQGGVSNLTYVNVGQKATLSFVVSNPGGPVTVESLTFAFPAFGQAGTDFAPTPPDVTPVLPTGWHAVSGTTFTVTPTGGSAQIGTGSLIFEFLVNVNTAPGTASFGITEVTAQGTAYAPSISVTKMPADFVLANLGASPALVEPSGTVTLTWNATPGQPYSITYAGGTGSATAPTGGQATWTSPAVQTNYPSLAFTVSATRQVSGSALSVSASTSVTVDAPQLIAFPQPGAFYSAQATLTWQTVNADHCVLYANGVVVDANAPANPPAGGYTVYPRAHVTPYQLYAYKGTTAVASQTVYVTTYNWTYLRSASFGDVSAQISLALNGDGSVLYYGGNSTIYALDTGSFAVIAQTPVAGGVAGPQGLALSMDGRKLFASVAQGQLAVFDTTNLSAAPTMLAVTSGPMALSPDGSTLYTVPGPYSGGPTTMLSAVNTGTNAVTSMVDLGGSGVRSTWGVRVSPDGSTVYVASGGYDATAPIVSVDVATCAVTSVATVFPGLMALTKDGGTIYACGAGSVSGVYVTSTVSAIGVPGFATNWSVTPIATPTPYVPDNYAQTVGLAVDPSGGLYVAVLLMGVPLPDGSTPGTAYYFVNPGTHTATLLTSASWRPNFPGMLVDPTGQRLYLANCEQVVVFSSSSGGSASFDADAPPAR